MTEAARLEKIIERFKLIEPVPADIRKNLIKSRDKVLKSTLKEVDNYSIWFAIVIFIILKARKAGIKISFSFAKAIAAAALIITFAAIITGAYAVIENNKMDFINSTIEKKNSETEGITGIEVNKAESKQNEIMPYYTIILYNGKVYHGTIKSRGQNYAIVTSQGIVNIHARQIKLIKRE